MARLIKIYDADWAIRKKRPAHLDERVWIVSPEAVGSAQVLVAPLWLVARHTLAGRLGAAAVARPLPATGLGS